MASNGNSFGSNFIREKISTMTDTKKFSLKDHLFNREKVEKIAREISGVYPGFKSEDFSKKVLVKFPELELMQRVYWIRTCLREYLPWDYKDAVNILLMSLPPPCDPALSDDDFGSFIYSPYSYFVAEWGCVNEYVSFSLDALHQLTTRFSVEGPIRFFLNNFPEETMRSMSRWVDDDHYHIRRLVSEGTRPKLPWAKAITLQIEEPIPFLEILHTDRTRFVTRSVANHLNDISKQNADLVIKTLKRWHKAGKQDNKELDFITRHSLRSLVKNGHQDALELLGFSARAFKVENLVIKTSRVKVGEAVEFSFEIVSIANRAQALMIDYILHFQKNNGEFASKTYKIAKKTIAPKEVITIEKKHPLRVMTTRKLYPGTHKVELQINGKKFGVKKFLLAT